VTAYSELSDGPILTSGSPTARPRIHVNLAPGHIQWLSEPNDGIHRYFCAGVAVSFWYAAASVPLLLAIGSKVG
jgi:hypothetical protein